MIVEQRPSLIIIIGQKTQSVDIKTHAKRATRCPTRSVSNKLNCWVLTDVLLFTHLVHLPRAYASKPDNKKLPWIVYIPCRSKIFTQSVIIKNITPCVAYAHWKKIYLLSISYRLIIESGYRIGYKTWFNRQSYRHYQWAIAIKQIQPKIFKYFCSHHRWR